MLTPRCERRLVGVHPDLVRVVRRAARDWNDPATGFIVTEGLRTAERQRALVAAGASQTMKSRHIKAANGYGHAVDVAATVAGNVRWDWPLYAAIASRLKAAAKAERVPLEWGGDWRSFRDGPHFQLPWASYPGTAKEK